MWGEGHYPGQEAVAQIEASRSEGSTSIATPIRGRSALEETLREIQILGDPGAVICECLQVHLDSLFGRREVDIVEVHVE